MNTASSSSDYVEQSWGTPLRIRMLSTGSISFVLTLAVYLLTVAPTITERFGGVDGGELAATALSGGVPHPSGYPTFMVLARIALWVFPGEPAHNLALLSAIAMSFAAASMSIFVLQLAPRSIGVNMEVIIPAVFAGLLWGWSPRAWSQAIIPEVYAVYLCFLSLASLLVLLWIKTRRPAMFIATMGVIGLGTGAHLTILAALAGIVVVIVLDRTVINPRQFIAGLAAFVVGCAIYLCLPVWGARPVVPNWGDWTTFSGFWQHVSGAEYRYLVGIVPWSQRFGRISFVARDLVTQLGLLGGGLALWFGIAYGWNLQRSVMLFTATVALLSVVFAIGYGAADGEVYLLPWTWCWCVWAGLGAYALLGSLPARRQRAALLVVLLVVAAVPMAWRYPSLDLRGDTSVRERVVTRLQTLAPDALLVTTNDAATFGTWYVQTALGTRPDVVPVDVRLLGRSWYDAQLRRRLNAPVGTSLCDVLRQSSRPVYAVTENGLAAKQTSEFWSMVAACAR